jgi:FlaA1/EpsC-like NDP-sugar epimerase
MNRRRLLRLCPSGVPSISPVTDDRGTSHTGRLPTPGAPDGDGTLIVGSGIAAALLLRDLQTFSGHSYRVVGFIAPESAPEAGPQACPYLGNLASLAAVVVRQEARHVLVAGSGRADELFRTVVSQCAGLPVRVRPVAVACLSLQDHDTARLLRDLSPEDLLSRRRIALTPDDPLAWVGRRVMVTGAAGTIGSEVCRQLVALGAWEVIGVDMHENGLYLLEQQVNQAWQPRRFAAHVADLRDRRRVEDLVARLAPQDIFHCAAHKHVPLMERAPCEAVKNNISATRHLLCAAERAGVDSFTFISSDKAVAPTSVMGATKRIGEIMTRAVAERSSLSGCAVRFGNVIGSDGSVVPLFRQQIDAGGPVTITHPDAQRYFMTTAEAVGLVLKAAHGRYGDLCVLNMGDPVRILDLARHMIALAGYVPEVDIPIVTTGLRPGEKLHEELTAPDESITLAANGHIRVVGGLRPPADLWSRIEQLERAAEREDETGVLEQLRELVPAYQRPTLIGQLTA